MKIMSRAARMAGKRLELRKQYWPDVPDEALWVRQSKKGFITIPRTMPLMCLLMDGMSKNKPVSSTYFSLWCRTYDDCMVTIANPAHLAFESGFTGQRALQSWLGRMKKLEELGFIMGQPGAAGAFSHVLLPNPYLVIRQLRLANTEQMSTAEMNALIARAVEIGADDLVLPNKAA